MQMGGLMNNLSNSNPPVWRSVILKIGKMFAVKFTYLRSGPAAHSSLQAPEANHV